MKVKTGMIFKSKGSGVVIEILKRKDGNKHWHTRKLGGGKSHQIHEGTLEKFYEVVS